MTQPANESAGPFSSPETVADALAGTGYLAGRALSTAVFLAGRMGRPLLLEGEPGVGKTSLAQALAAVRGCELIRLQCYEGIDASQALYDWDFPRQVLHLRAVQAISGGDGRIDRSGSGDLGAIENELYTERFLLQRPILAALRRPGAVLLIDEIDRADDEFEAFLLEVLTDYAVTIPELGRVAAAVPPMVVITSNRTREVHDALKRRCLYHWIEHPTVQREVQILMVRLPGIERELAGAVALAVARLRAAELIKPPGVAESLDWAAALRALGASRLTAQAGLATIGAVLKYREDIEAVTADPSLLTGSPAR